MGFGAVSTSPVSTFVEIWFDSLGWVGNVASGIKDLSWFLKFKVEKRCFFGLTATFGSIEVSLKSIFKALVYFENKSCDFST